MYVQIYIRSSEAVEGEKSANGIGSCCDDVLNQATFLLLLCCVAIRKSLFLKAKKFPAVTRTLGRKCHIFEYFNFLSNGNGAQFLET